MTITMQRGLIGVEVMSDLQQKEMLFTTSTQVDDPRTAHAHTSP